MSGTGQSENDAAEPPTTRDVIESVPRVINHEPEVMHTRRQVTLHRAGVLKHGHDVPHHASAVPCHTAGVLQHIPTVG